MKKTFLKIFLLNFLFVIILLFVNTFFIKINFFAFKNIVVLFLGILLSIIVTVIVLKQIKTEKAEFIKLQPKTTKEKFLYYLNEIEKMDIDKSTLESVYLTSIKFIDSIVTDKNTFALIEKHFCSLLESEIKRASRYNLKFGLILLNLYKPDNKIELNEILRNIALSSKKILRIVDVVGRYKEGLAYLLPQTDLKGSIRAAERILNEIKKIKILNKEGENVEFKVNIGLSCFPLDGKNSESLLKYAEKNLFQSELLGGDKIIFGRMD